MFAFKENPEKIYLRIKIDKSNIKYLSSNEDLRRLNTLLFKIIRLHCCGFSCIFSNAELCLNSGQRSFNSVRIIRDTTMLHVLCTNPSNTSLTLRLVQQSLCSSRYPNRLSFFDNSIRRVGRYSFVNRVKRVAELITFAWADLSCYSFKRLINNSVPLHIS